MDGIPIIALTALAIILFIAAGLWLIIPLLTGLPWVPTRGRRIRAALRLAGVLPGELVYDLGAGDGRVLLAAARDFGARAVGVEISPIHCFIAWLRANLSGCGKRVTVHWGSFYHADLSNADVVYAYVTSHQAARLRSSLEIQLRPGARVVTISTELDGWQPEQIDQQDLIFLYRMPPTPGSAASYLTKHWIGV